MTQHFRDTTQHQNGSTITSSSPTCIVGPLLYGAGLSGLAAPYSLRISKNDGVTNAEIVTVTSTASYPTLSITRGASPLSHDTTEVLTQVVSAADLQNLAQLDGTQQSGQLNLTGPGVFGGKVQGDFFQGSIVALTYAATISLDPTVAELFTTTTTSGVGNATINAASAGLPGQHLYIQITNDATAARTITFGTNFSTSGTLTGAISKTAVVECVSDGTTWHEVARSTGASTSGGGTGNTTGAVLDTTARAGILIPGAAMVGSAVATEVPPTVAPVVGAILNQFVDTSANVHPAAIFSGGAATMASSTPPVDLCWGWDTFNETSYLGIDKGAYFPMDRTAGGNYGYTPPTLAWFETNHPDWIMYHGDGVTVAYGFGHSQYIPLDTQNPAVTAYLRAWWSTVLSRGYYKVLAIDNWALEQGSWTGSRVGHWSSTTAPRSGSFVTQYNGTTNDPNWRAAQIAYAADCLSWLRTNFPTIALSLNISWNPALDADSVSLMNSTDIMEDEQGFQTNTGTGVFLTGTNCVTKLARVASFLAQPNKGWITINDMNNTTTPSTAVSRAQHQWALGTYLLVKNNKSWTFFGDTTGQYAQNNVLAEYTAAVVGTPINTYYAYQGVYRRDFTKGFVVVNPNATSAFNLTGLPMGGATTYHDLYGVLQTSSSLTLPAQSALTFVTP